MSISVTFRPKLVEALKTYSSAQFFADLVAGVILLIMGFARLGGMIKFIPYPVTVGFTSGIAVLIFSTQIRDFFGLQLVNPMPSEFVGKLGVFFTHLGNIHWPTLALAFVS